MNNKCCNECKKMFFDNVKMLYLTNEKIMNNISAQVNNT